MPLVSFSSLKSKYDKRVKPNVLKRGIYHFVTLNRNLASSSWSTENVDTIKVEPNGNNSFKVTCESQHLTSFSILVDVNNAKISVSQV